MLDPSKLDQLAQSLAARLPPGLNNLRDELETNFRTVLQSQFNKLDLVTREQFDIQAELLSRTRSKLDELNKRLDALEKT